MKKQITYHDNGKIFEEVSYKDGRKDGECASYSENGEKELVGYFKKGKPTGIWLHWDKNGDYDWINMDLKAKLPPLLGFHIAKD